MFLLARESGIAPRERYWFVPYNYGPMSPALYRDLERLEEDGLIERTLVLDESWRRLTATEEGMRRARALRRRARRASPRAVAELARIKRRIVDMTFAELIADVYRRYPYFARRSVFPPSFTRGEENG
jgi:DNA-binding PadR family transcriptional regulator